MNNYIIETRNLSFRYRQDSPLILDHVNLGIRKGEVVGIVGLSGSGKSTLINIINGIIPKRIDGVIEGDVIIKNENIEQKELHELVTTIGTVFQDPDCQILFSCAEDEMAFAPENLCFERMEIFDSIDKVCGLLDIGRLRDKNPNHMSGGEKQLISIASVLTPDVDIVILDECMSQIDERGRLLIKDTLKKLKEKGKTVIMIEHDFSNLETADTIYLLDLGRLSEFDGELK
ncbi:energy-coupling factor transport system ATP-binding protein [Dethiosulfatibacter aminovorans DSM 17477]|uniref:Energy-coupling factor transport system ATP-binding protein n=1 Tax=Dethiosulfatibacter aminovorans DSM 17477 TaxID=1121476 RepID=A0A1M6HHL7_9FIRM|nr:ABC transporter ATP-binding protein [Dethiosulfatibacter aminovorans]SHJ21684.1 energy-coupling factor transport system ATP-binding protein [Dethiosulfatibacter aminovorans DSM 17477]